MVTVELSYPVEREGQEPLTRVVLKRLRVREVAALEAAKERGEIAAIVAIVASLNDLPASVVEEIDASDIERITEALVPFLEAVGGSGGRSSPKSRTS